MNSAVFQDRQHLSVQNLNGIYNDLDTYLAQVLNDTLPVAGTVIGNGFSAVNSFPVLTQNQLTLNGGTAYDPTLLRIDTSNLAAPPYVQTWANNSSGTGLRNDIVYIYGSLNPTDLVTVFFLSATGTIFEQPIYQRISQDVTFGVAIGGQYSGVFSPTQDPSIPSNAIPLYRVYNHVGSAYITGVTDTGSNAFANVIAKIYPFTFEDGFSLENLSDVEISNVADGQTIRWSVAQQAWVNASDLEGPPAYPFSNATTVTVIHNLGFNPLVQIINSSNVQILPDSVTYTSDMNSFTVTFTTAQTGNIIFK